MANEKIPGVVGEIDTPEEVDAVENYVERTATRDAILLVIISLSVLAIGGWFIIHQDKVHEMWNSLPWPSSHASEPSIIEKSVP